MVRLLASSVLLVRVVMSGIHLDLCSLIHHQLEERGNFGLVSLENDLVALHTSVNVVKEMLKFPWAQNVTIRLSQNIQDLTAEILAIRTDVYFAAQLFRELVNNLLGLLGIIFSFEVANHYQIHRVFRSVSAPDFHCFEIG